LRLQVREDIEGQIKLGKQLSKKQAEAESDEEEFEKPIAEIPKKKSTEIPLILAPSQTETEANPWLSTTSVVLPSSEYSKPTEVRNEDTSSSSESENEEGEVEAPPKDELPASYGVTATKPLEHLNMPIPTKRMEIEPQRTEQHHMNIQEAFVDDDVLAEFEKEKVI
jgi:hypothetical protein